VRVSQLPGTYNTEGTYGRGAYQATTTYQPGPTVVSGSHDQGISIVMFREGEPAAQQAVGAREVLGPDWEEKVRKGVSFCF
jgi:hypothetical protein